MTAAASELVVERLDVGRYRVSGGAEPHVVTVDRDKAVCDCADYRFRQRQCKHLAAVIHYLIMAPLEPAIAAAAGPGLERDVPLPDDQADGST